MDIATTKFQEALPYALLSVSPSLSALHSVRTSFGLGSCKRCGCALHRGESSVRTIRRKSDIGNGKARALQTTCLICGFQWESPMARGNAALFPRTKKARTINPEATVVHLSEEKATVSKVQGPSGQSVAVEKPPRTRQAAPSPVPSAKPGISTAQPGAPLSTPKSRPKKKGGLQSMLERNKERELKEKQNGSGGGLAMFLNNL